MVMMMSQAPTSLRETMTELMKSVCGFVYVSYRGTLAQWRAFMGAPLALPQTLSDVKIQFDYKRGLDIKFSRFEMLVPTAVVTIDDDSVLMLKYSYMRDGAGTVWDLGGVYLENNPQNKTWVGLLRQTKPSPALPEDIKRVWQTKVTGAHPWDGVPFMSAGRSEINAMVNMKDVVAGRTDIGYTMTLSSEGAQPIGKMKSEFSALERGFTIYRKD
jgi:hypothetical protein